MLRGIKVRLYPNKEQQARLNQVLGCYRFVYNKTLELKKTAYDEDKTNLKLTDISKWFHGTLLKDGNYAWLQEQNTKVMKQSIRQMLGAYDKFFKQHNGFPKFKSKKDKQSALFPSEAISKRNTFNERKITLTQDLKDIRFRCSDLYHKRLRVHKDCIKSATVSRTAVPAASRKARSSGRSGAHHAKRDGAPVARYFATTGVRGATRTVASPSASRVPGHSPLRSAFAPAARNPS